MPGTFYNFVDSAPPDTVSSSQKAFLSKLSLRTSRINNHLQCGYNAFESMFPSYVGTVLGGTILCHFCCSLSGFPLRNQQESPLTVKTITGVEPLAARVCVPPASPSSSHFTDTFTVI